MAGVQRDMHRALAYGFPLTPTNEVLMRTMEGRAMLALGPLRAFYSQSRGTWTLDQKPCESWDMVIEAKRLGKSIGY
jgi:hypothetical protein